MNLKNEILRLLAENGRLEAADIAERLHVTEKSAQKAVKELEADGVIVGYRAMFDETVLPETAVKAIIEVKTKPERNGGFDRIAQRIARFPEVTDLYLLSGNYDCSFGCAIFCKTFGKIIGRWNTGVTNQQITPWVMRRNRR